jgi:hypothetical protein
MTTAATQLSRRSNMGWLLLTTLLCIAFFSCSVGIAQASNPQIAGSEWMGGKGVNACNQTEHTVHYCGGEYEVGLSWQCVELAQREWQKMGWYTGKFGVEYAYEIYNSTVASRIGATLHANGSGYIPVPGDLIIHNHTSAEAPGEYNAGHVAVVSSVSGSKVYTVEQNYEEKAHVGEYTLSGSTLSRTIYDNGHVMPILGVVHSNSNVAEPTTPPSVPWRFENLDGDPGSIGGNNYNLGQTPTEILFKGELYVFYYDTQNGFLRYAWANESGWHFAVLDGEGGSNGRVSENVGRAPSVTIYEGTLQLFYYDSTAGSLRHAWSSNGTTWNFETLDGPGSSITGHSEDNLGETPTAIVADGGDLEVFYYDVTAETLRHAWENETGWHFETLDGSSGSVSGHVANVGTDPTSVVYEGNLNLFYDDISNGDLRHAWENETGWHFENLDGDAGSISGYTASVDHNPTAVVFGETLQVFYYNETDGDLRHAWEAPIVGWQFENLEGETGTVSSNHTNVGLMPYATVLNGSLQLFYYQLTGGNLRHAWTTETGWKFENLDGEGGEPAGRVNDDTGYDPVAIADEGHIQLFYTDVSNGNLRHAISE